MDDAAFIQMCTESTATLYRVAFSILRKQQDAEDAVQQALMKGWVSRKRIWKGSEQAWMMRVVINECRNIQRHRMRVSPIERLPDNPSDWPDIALRVAVDALPETLRLPLLLKYMESMSEKEIALALRLSVSAVKSRLHRARQALRNELNEEVEWP